MFTEVSLMMVDRGIFLWWWMAKMVVHQTLGNTPVKRLRFEERMQGQSRMQK